MLPLRIGIAAGCLDHPLKRSLAIAQEMGAQGIQFDARRELVPSELSQTGRRQFLHQLDEMGLAVASLSFPIRRSLGDLDRLDARVEAIKQAMEFAASLKCRVLSVRLGSIPSEEASEDRSRLLGVLNDLTRFGNHVGATLAATPSRESSETLAQLVTQVTQGPLGVNFDALAFLSAGSDPSEALQTLHQLIVHVQVRDAVQEADGPAREVQLGRGEVEWDVLLALLDEAGYRGWLTVDRTEGSDKQNDAARAIEYLRRIGLGG